LLKTVWEVTAALESAKAEIGSYRTIVAKFDADAARAKALATVEVAVGTIRIALRRVQLLCRY
jgi:hypothetical protein